MTKELNPDWPVFVENHEGDEGVREIILDVRNLHAGPITDRDGREYQMVTQALENDDFYQGLNKVTVIRRKSDQKYFGYFWWDDISKHGEPYVEPNGDEFGLEGYCAVEDDWDTFTSYYVFVPVEPHEYIMYKESE